MINVSITQARTRIQTLPEHIKDVVFAEHTSDIIHEIAAANHIPLEKVPDLAMTASLALLGFLHVEDVAQEIRDRLGVNNETARTLADDLTKKIFRPIKDDLDPLYAPPAAELQEKSAVIPTTIPFTTPKMSEGSSFAPTQASELQTGKTISGVPIPRPPTRQTPPQETPAPFILHEEAESKPIEKPSEFRFELGKEFFKKQTAPTVPPPRPPRPATIEIGEGILEKKGSQVARVGTPAPRVVHYSEIRTPIMKQAPEATNQAPDIVSQKTGTKESEKEKIVNLTDFKIE